MSPDSFADAVVRIVRDRGHEPDAEAVRTWVRRSVARAVAGGRSEMSVLVAMSPQVCAGHWIGEMYECAQVDPRALPSAGQVPLSA